MSFGVHENESILEQGYSPIKQQPIWCMTLNRYCFELFFFSLLWGWGLKVRRGHWKHWWRGGHIKPWLILKELKKMESVLGILLFTCIQHMTNLWIGIKNENDKEMRTHNLHLHLYTSNVGNIQKQGYEKQFHKWIL